MSLVIAFTSEFFKEFSLEKFQCSGYVEMHGFPAVIQSGVFLLSLICLSPSQQGVPQNNTLTNFLSLFWYCSGLTLTYCWIGQN